MKVTASQIAALIGGVVEGDPAATVTRPMRIEEAVAGDFAFFDNPKYEHHAYTTGASVLLVSDAFQPTHPVSATMIRVPEVRASLAQLLEYFSTASNGSKKVAEISAQAFIDPAAQVGAGTSVGHFAVIEAGAVIGDNCVVHPQVFIGRDVRIGNGTVLHSGVKIYAGCVIGDDCLIHANAVIGGDGFGFAPLPDGSWKKVPHVGNVILENDVEIGANSCVDRAAMGSTLLCKGVKIDNLVHIAHNVEVGENTAMAAQVGIANAVIGGDGFGFAPLPDGSWKKVPHVGNVILENDVEIGANSCVDRAAMGSTLLCKRVKIDNLVHIAHNVEVGENTAMAAQVGIAGSAKIGPNCMLGGQTGVAGHISLAKGTRTQAQSGVGSNIKEEGTALFGSPAIPYNDYVRAYIVFKQLPELSKKVRALEKGK